MKRSVFVLLFVSATAFCGISAGCSEKEGTDATEQMSAATYQCPMKCEGDKTYSEAGQCPVCNMDLEKRDDKG